MVTASRTTISTIALLSVCIFSLRNLHGAQEISLKEEAQRYHNSGGADKYRQNSLYFYAALMQITREKHKHTAQSRADSLLTKQNIGPNENKKLDEKMTVLAHKDYDGGSYKKRTLVLVKDKYGDLHVAVEGREDITPNWGQIGAYLRGIFKDKDLPAEQRAGVHDVIKKMVEKNGGGKQLTSLVGDKLGGTYVSQLADDSDRGKKYKQTKILTINAPKVKNKGGIGSPSHYLISNKPVATATHPNGRYRALTITYGNEKIYNRGMLLSLTETERKSWQEIDKKSSQW